MASVSSSKAYIVKGSSHTGHRAWDVGNSDRYKQDKVTVLTVTPVSIPQRTEWVMLARTKPDTAKLA